MSGPAVAERIAGLPRPVREAGLAVALAAALIELTWRLGASSLFVDEVSSWSAADGSLGHLFHNVRAIEVAPPGYYLLLHAWIRIFGSDGESLMRALSVIAGVLLVAVIYWAQRRSDRLRRSRVTSRNTTGTSGAFKQITGTIPMQAIIATRDHRRG